MQRNRTAMRTSGSHSSSRAAGRSVDAAGAADAPGSSWTPSDAIRAASPGVMFDSAASNRSTANRSGAFGSIVRADGLADALPLGAADGATLAEAAPALGDPPAP